MAGEGQRDASGSGGGRREAGGVGWRMGFNPHAHCLLDTHENDHR